MSLCTNLQEKVLDLEKAKTTQAKEINRLKKRFKQLEKRRKSRTSGLRRLRKGRKIKDLNADAKVTLVDETQEMNDDNLMFDTGVLEEQEIEFKKVVEEHVVSVATTTKSIPVSAAEVVTTASASVEIPDELTLAQTLIEIKTAKPKPVTTAATTVTSVRPRAKGIIFHDQEEHIPASTKTFSSSQSQLSQVKGKGKGKGKLVEPEVPFKKTKDQVALDEEMARNLEAQLQAELIEEERLARQKEKDSLKHRFLIEFVVEEINDTYGAYNGGRLLKVVDKEQMESSKRAGDELEFDKSKKQKIDKHVEIEKCDDLAEEEMKKHIEIVQDEEEIAIDAIPLATKPPMIVEYKIVKEGQKGFYHLIRADRSSKRYSLMIKML
ncbi:hypothetical protein Tco_1329044 [Tanacetum coccineum]